MGSDVIWVINTLGENKVDMFIKKYIIEYDNILRSKLPDPPRRSVPGIYFINFIETCRKCLFTNKQYYNYNRVTRKCNGSMLGPNLVYSLLLKNIVHNATRYGKEDAEKIHTLLFWFEQQGITQLVVVPLDKPAKDIFETHQVLPRYTGQEDGTLGYCSLKGNPHETGGMEISNTRVNELLNAIYRITDDADADADADGDDGSAGGKKRQIHKSRTRCSHRTATKSKRTRTQRRRRRATRTRRN